MKSLVTGYIFSLFFSLIFSLAPYAVAEDSFLANGNNDFGSRLLLNQKLVAGNKVLSPYSAQQALLMLANGAQGSTLDLLLNNIAGEQQALAEVNTINAATLNRFDAWNQDDVVLQVVNSIWVHHTFAVENSFLRQLKNNYGAQIQNVNMEDANATAKLINNWVENKTKDPRRPALHGSIQNILEPSDLADARLLMVNALYVKGPWQIPFSEDATVADSFKLDRAGSIKSVKMMNNEGGYRYLGSQIPGNVRYPKGFEVIDLPLGQNAKLSMVIILPTVDDVATAEAYFEQPQVLNQTLKVLDEQPLAYGHVTLPKFKVESKIDFRDTLERLNMGLLFTEDADFTGISADSRLRVTRAIQKTLLDVSEYGVEAAAATSTAVGITGLEPPTFNFKADRPFIVILREVDFNNVLFIGTITNP